MYWMINLYRTQPKHMITLLLRPPPSGRVWSRGHPRPTLGQRSCRSVRLLLPVQGLPITFVFSFEFRRRGVADPAVELPPSSRSGVAAWGNGWEEDFWFFFSKDWRKEDDPVFLPTLIFFVFFLFHADMSTYYWWAKRWWFLPPPNRSYSHPSLDF